MTTTHYKSEQKGHLYIVGPTLEILALSCTNLKEAAYTSGIEYSNFLKACKMENDIRISTYQKCAAGLGKDVLIIHLPCGIIDSLTAPKVHFKNRYETIEQRELVTLFRELKLDEKIQIEEFMKLFISYLSKQDRDHLMKPFLSAIEELCHKLLNENGKQ